VALPYPDPRLTDGAVLLRPWKERDAPLVERAARDECVAAIEHLPRPFTVAAGREGIAERAARLLCRWAPAEAGVERLQATVGRYGTVRRGLPYQGAS
jgi:hypothetical protein